MGLENPQSIDIFGAWGRIGESRDRFPVVSLEIFPKLPTEPSDMGSTQPLKMSTTILLGVKTDGV